MYLHSARKYQLWDFCLLKTWAQMLIDLGREREKKEKEEMH